MQLIHGYTLIELLLVISVLAMIATLSMNIYQQHQENQRAEKAALEMQTFAAAALDFETVNGKWPQANPTCNDGLTPREDDFIENYVPNQSATSSLGNDYCWSAIMPEQVLFQIAVKIPHHSVQLAKHMVALLPNAFVTSSPTKKSIEPCRHDSENCYVRMEITRTTGHHAGTWLAGVGNCIPGKNIPGSAHEMHCDYEGPHGKDPKPVDYRVEFNCPPNMRGNLIAVPNYLFVGVTKKRPFTLLALQAGAQECRQSGDTYQTHVSCQLSINAIRANGKSVTNKSSRFHGRVGASYTAYCSALAKHSPTFSY